MDIDSWVNNLGLLFQTSLFTGKQIIETKDIDHFGTAFDNLKYAISKMIVSTL